MDIARACSNMADSVFPTETKLFNGQHCSKFSNIFCLLNILIFTNFLSKGPENLFNLYFTLEIHGKFSLSIISQFKKSDVILYLCHKLGRWIKNPSELAVPHKFDYYRYICVPVFILYIFHFKDFRPSDKFDNLYLIIPWVTNDNTFVCTCV